VELLLAIVVLAIACMAMGLLVSAIVNTSEKTMPVLVLLSMAQVILSGGLLALSVGLNQLSWLTPARWGFAATASTVNLNVISAPGIITVSPLWDHKPSTWLMDMGLQVLLAVLFSLVAWWRLVRLSPGRTRR
jgi:ABC-type transport system involved in multi-copper enzyme maturation permease subunit